MSLVENITNRAPTAPPSAMIDQRSGKPKRVPRKVRHAVRLILTGEVTNIKAAAERVGLSREHLSRCLGMPHVEVFSALEARKTIAAGKLRASARLIELMDCKSEHVSFEATKHALAIEGIRPPETGTNININNNLNVGYILDLRPDQPMHAHTPQAPNTVQVIDNAEGGE
jgi:hypothetical protein